MRIVTPDHYFEIKLRGLGLFLIICLIFLHHSLICLHKTGVPAESANHSHFVILLIEGSTKQMSTKPDPSGDLSNLKLKKVTTIGFVTVSRLEMRHFAMDHTELVRCLWVAWFELL